MSSPDRRILSMLTRGQVYLFGYAPGMELAVLQQLIALARDPDVDFDWFDAAVLSYQLGEQVARQSDCGPLGDQPPVGQCGPGVPPVNPTVHPRPLQLDAHGRPLHVDPLYLDDSDGEVPPCA